MTFQVGDWVRRKEQYQGDFLRWPYGDSEVQVTAYEDSVCGGDIGVNGGPSGRWCSAHFELVRACEPFDPHALGMALQFARIMQVAGLRGTYDDDMECRPHGGASGCYQCTADWLRAEVQRELLSQETPRGGE